MTGAEVPAIDLREVLAPYGIEGGRVAPLPGGMVNLSFRVDAPDGAFVLKWYRPGLSVSQPERLRFVCETQVAMHEVGAPAPVIISDLGGNLFAEKEAGNFVLTEFVEGRQFPRGQMPAGCAVAMGAALHHVFEALTSISTIQRRRLIPSVDEGLARIERLARIIEARGVREEVDEAALVILEERRRGLERWRGPPPDLGPLQCIHGDYQDSNVIFGRDASLGAVIDWDNLGLSGRPYEVMRAFNYSFPDGAPGGMEFLEGYVRAARPEVEYASTFVDVWSYITLQRTWPIDVRYEQPELYQPRWDTFIREPTGWWEANRERVRRELVRLAREAAS